MAKACFNVDKREVLWGYDSGVPPAECKPARVDGTGRIPTKIDLLKGPLGIWGLRKGSVSPTHQRARFSQSTASVIATGEGCEDPIWGRCCVAILDAPACNLAIEIQGARMLKTQCQIAQRRGRGARFPEGSIAPAHGQAVFAQGAGKAFPDAICWNVPVGESVGSS